MSASSAGVMSGAGWRLRMSIEHCWRIVWKPACISLHTARAMARFSASSGQTSPGAAHSAMNSVIARLSQTWTASQISSGSLAVGLSSFSRAVVSGKSRGKITSSTGRPTFRATSRGRIDQLE